MPPLKIAYESSENALDNFGKVVHEFQNETKILIRKLKRIFKKTI